MSPLMIDSNGKGYNMRGKGSFFGFLICILFCGMAKDSLGKTQTAAPQEPINITADSLEIKNGAFYAVFLGHVCAIKGKKQLHSDELTIYYEDSKAQGSHLKKETVPTKKIIKRIEAIGNVLFIQDKQRATGDKANFLPQKNLLILTGKQVVLVDKKTIANGCKLSIHTDTGEALLQGCSSVKQPNQKQISFTFIQK